MALNLNKGESNEKLPPGTGKKGLNLNKSGDSDKGSFKLTKEKAGNTTSTTIERPTDPKEPPKKYKRLLLLLLLLIGIIVIVFAVKNWTSNGTNQVVADNIELATSKANEIIHNLQSGNIDLDDAQAQVAETQKMIDDAKANAKTDKEKQAVAEAEGKVDEVRKIVEQKKTDAETITPVTDEAVNPVIKYPVTDEQPSAKSALPEKPTQSSSEKSVATSSRIGQSTADKPTESRTTAPTLPQGTLEEKAMQVIRGDFGNGDDRKRALGNEYGVIQNRVNEMYRMGEVR